MSRLHRGLPERRAGRPDVHGSQVGRWSQVNWFWLGLPPVSFMTPKFMFFSKFCRPSESEITFDSLGLRPPDTKTNILKNYYGNWFISFPISKRVSSEDIEGWQCRVIKSGKCCLNSLPLPMILLEAILMGLLANKDGAGNKTHKTLSSPNPIMV